MRIFITGSSGFIGSHLKEDLLLKGHEVTGPNSHELDLVGAGRDEIERFVAGSRPEAIVHLAAIKDMAAISDPKTKEAAYALNVTTSKLMADIAESLGCQLIFISSDLVFDGKQGGYKEDEPASPLNEYGRMKIEAEEYIRSKCSRYTICRTSGVYGFFEKKDSFIDYVIASLKGGKEVMAYSNITNSPTLVYDVCDFIELLLKDEPATRNQVFHVCGDERLNRFEFGRRIASVFGYDRELVKEARKEGIDKQDTSLDNSKAKLVAGFAPKTLKRGLNILRGELNDQEARDKAD